jgi:large subunit ribosomal protein L25
MIKLEAKKRDIKEDLTGIRKNGLIPAVFYGKKTNSTPISVSQVEFLKTWKAAGESTVVTLTHPDGDVDALIHDIDFDPVTGVPRHADFYVFDKDLKLKLDVPIEFVGVAPAVKDLGGMLVKVLYEIKIEALPANLPHQLDLDVSSLVAFGDQLTAKDIKLPAGVSLVENPDEVVALVAQPKEEVEEAPAEAVDLSAIEVEKKGKEKNAEEGVEAEPAKE